jgi:hypothetical protein
MEHTRDYIDCVAKEAELRESGEVVDLATFIPLRRGNSAVFVCFDLFEYVLDFDLPDEVFEDATFMRLFNAATDLVCWSNVSFRR